MKRHRCSATIALLIISIAAPAAFGEDYFIYAPRPVAETEKRNLQIGKEEVLVREVLVKKGDTLSKLSRKYSGRGSYYPQILLFNEINNPNLIYAGASLKVPVSALQRDAETVRPVTPEKGVEGEVKKDSLTPTSQRRVATGSKTQKSGRKKRGSEKAADRGTTRIVQPEKTARSVPPAGPENKTALPVSPVKTEDAQRVWFDQAMSAYRQNDCMKAVDLFDRFLSENQASSLSAEASLLKAECLLKLSGTP